MTKQNFLLLFDKIFRISGFHIEDDGLCITSNIFARMICELGVRGGEFIRIEKGKYRVNENGN
jgi:hypothetical protein